MDLEGRCGGEMAFEGNDKSLQKFYLSKSFAKMRNFTDK
jgi:hypothetical protein